MPLLQSRWPSHGVSRSQSEGIQRYLCWLRCVQSFGRCSVTIISLSLLVSCRRRGCLKRLKLKHSSGRSTCRNSSCLAMLWGNTRQTKTCCIAISIKTLGELHGSHSQRVHRSHTGRKQLHQRRDSQRLQHYQLRTFWPRLLTRRVAHLSSRMPTCLILCVTRRRTSIDSRDALLHFARRFGRFF